MAKTKRKRSESRRGPEPVGNIIAEIMAWRGIGRQRSAEARQLAWSEAVGQRLAEMTRCGSVRRGRLEVIVANSLLMQELTFQKAQILAQLNQTMPEMQVKDLRFRVGPMEDRHDGKSA